MRRFNFMLNGSRLMMFPFYIGILICVVLLMVKFAMQLYQLSVNIDWPLEDPDTSPLLT